MSIAAGDAPSEGPPIEVEAAPISWTACCDLSELRPCPVCCVEMSAPGSQSCPPGEQPSPLVMCPQPSCGAVVLNTAAAPVRWQPQVPAWRRMLWPLVPCVWACVVFVIGYGVTVTIPRAVPPSRPRARLAHWAFAAWLSINVVGNLARTLLRAPGFPVEVAYERCHPLLPFCEQCNYPKPYGARHSRAAGRCVLQMDHWCTFANNVIGRDNRRPFVLFVLFIWLSSGYGTCMALLDASEIPVLQQAFQSVLPVQLGRALGLRSSVPVRPSAFVVVDLYRGMLLPAAMVLICSICFGMIGMLLFFQARLLVNGMTSVDYMQNGNQYANRRGRSSAANLAAVLGRRWWLTWALPFDPANDYDDDERHPQAGCDAPADHPSAVMSKKVD